jgi:nucleotide-binding universal stress UspA family protein
VVVLHVANDLNAWEFYSEDLAFLEMTSKPWPIDRILAETSLDLTRFLESHLQNLKKVPALTKRVILGSVAQQIVAVAEDEKADLIVMSPRRHRAFRHFFNGGITERVTRRSPCPCCRLRRRSRQALARQVKPIIVRLAASKGRRLLEAFEECIPHENVPEHKCANPPPFAKETSAQASATRGSPNRAQPFQPTQRHQLV